MKKIPFFLLFLLSVLVLPAQKKLVLEYIRCQSTKGPLLMYYWQNEDTKREFAGRLHTLLQKYYQVTLRDTANLSIEMVNENSKFDKATLYKNIDDTSTLHMYLTIFEHHPRAFFQGEITEEDSLLLNHAKTAFMLAVNLINKDSLIVHTTLDIIITPTNSPGFGIASNTVALTPKGFTEVLKVGMNMLLNPENNMTEIEVKAAPAFVADNFILAKIMGRPRVYVTTKKEVHSYDYNSREIIRLGEAQYQEIRLKGKNAVKIPASMEEIIRKTYNFSVSDFVFLRQESRDVVRNKNYFLQLIAQIDAENTPSNRSLLFTGFLKDPIHFLFNEKDTVAQFSIEKWVVDTNKKLYIDKITNGYDSASSFILGTGQQPPSDLIYDYVITGKIGKDNFSIKYAGFGNTLKEIYLNDILVCIAYGKFSPEKFVFLDSTISPELFNQLLIIGFNRFFE